MVSSAASLLPSPDKILTLVDATMEENMVGFTRTPPRIQSSTSRWSGNGREGGITEGGAVRHRGPDTSQIILIVLTRRTVTVYGAAAATSTFSKRTHSHTSGFTAPIFSASTPANHHHPTFYTKRHSYPTAFVPDSASRRPSTVPDDPSYAHVGVTFHLDPKHNSVAHHPSETASDNGSTVGL